ncbi:MAG: hypothetical protein DRH24_16870 [Deltaproteobacteria bacterium]|nr:MAG: hypothetical protein DRH24_16870 [Deltaproteobacteria bacterium]
MPGAYLWAYDPVNKKWLKVPCATDGTLKVEITNMKFWQLEDTPNDYTGQAGKAAVVKSTEDGLEFSYPSPAAHASSHQAGGSDVIDLRGLQGAWLTADTEANRPAAGTKDRYFYATDTGKLYYDDGTSWVEISTGLSVHGNDYHDPDMLPLDTSSAIEAYMSGNKWLSVATSGIVELPKQSYIRGYCDNGGSNISISGTTWTKVPYDTVVVDRHSEFDTTNHRFTATEDGLYFLQALVTFYFPTDQESYMLRPYKNGAGTMGIFRSIASGNERLTTLVAITLDLVAGDYIEIYTYSTADATVLVGEKYTFFSIVKVA